MKRLKGLDLGFWGGSEMKKVFLFIMISCFSSIGLFAANALITSVTPQATFSGMTVTTKDFVIQFSMPISTLTLNTWPNQVKELDFVLQNLSNEPIKVLWDSCAYIDPNGNSHRVMHEGIKYITRDQPMPPSIVAPDSKIEDVVTPTDNVQWIGDNWSVSPLFNPIPGTTFGSLLSLKINGKVENYIVHFAVSGSTPGKVNHILNHRAGLSLLLFGSAMYGDNGQITGYQGLNLLLSYTAQYYFNKVGIQLNQFNWFWQWGTVALILPCIGVGRDYVIPIYIGVGGDYVIPTSKTSDLVLTIGTIYFHPYAGISFDF